MRLDIDLRRVGYRNQTVLSDLRFSVETGEFLSIIGKNGVGKSTLLSAIASLLPYEGSILADGTPLSDLSPKERARRISLLPQSPRAPHVTVEELVWFGLYPDLRPLHRADEAAEARVARALADAELTALSHRFVDRLSGGERMRAYLGATLAQNTPILLLDEPTSSMDAAHEHRFLSLVRRLSGEQHKTVIAVTHDLSAAFRFSDRILLLDGQTPTAPLPPEQLLADGRLTRALGVCHQAVTQNGNTFPLFYVPEPADGTPSQPI